MEIEKELREFRELLNNLTNEEFDNILENAGIEVIGYCKDEDKVLLSNIE